MRGKVTTPSGVWKLKLPQDLESLILFPLGTVGFPGGSAGRESTCNAGDLGLIPGLGRSPGEEKGYPRQYSCLENSMEGGSWGAIVQGGGVLQKVGHN